MHPYPNLGNILHTNGATSFCFAEPCALRDPTSLAQQTRSKLHNVLDVDVFSLRSATRYIPLRRFCAANAQHTKHKTKR